MKIKDLRFHINLYLIIPFIFAGLSVLSLLVSYRLTMFYLDRNMAPEWPLAFWGFLLVIFTFVCGLFTVKFLIDPVKRFVVKTQTMGVLRDINDTNELPAKSPEIHQFSRVFDQVSELLSKVEARQLFPEIVGQSESMRGVFNQILKVAPTDSTVLIVGETGTGKELVANSIHRHSRRQGSPFIAINCAAIPEGLLESELFGHEKGAFTGADASKPGKFELADDGTLFLDEIGDMPLETQAKVLRTLEEKQIQRVGSVNDTKVDVRFIAATNKKLPETVQRGEFREDHYYRLNVFAIYLPPLRERREDIPLISDHFLQNTDPDKQLSSNAIQLLMAYDWPGNVRELQNAIKSSAVMARRIIEAVHLPSFITQSWHHDQALSAETINPLSPQSLDQRVQLIEKQLIIQALTQSRGVQKHAARLLGIKERSLWHRLKKYEIDASSFKVR
jgi:transcriptional regulator with GAF, ATPase, and Fis domain